MTTDKKGWEMRFNEFNRRFETKIKNYPSYTAAYEAVEEEHEQESGSRKYSCYKSFQVFRARKIKKGN